MQIWKFTGAITIVGNTLCWRVNG